jgi:predicted DNA-binding transcriptional regulator AlpA
MATNPQAGHIAGSYFGADPKDRLLNEHEAAAYLGLAVATLRRWRWSGDGPNHVKLGPAKGAAVRYEPHALAQFVAAGVRASTGDPGREAA